MREAARAPCAAFDSKGGLDHFYTLKKSKGGEYFMTHENHTKFRESINKVLLDPSHTHPVHGASGRSLSRGRAKKLHTLCDSEAENAYYVPLYRKRSADPWDG